MGPTRRHHCYRGKGGRLDGRKKVYPCQGRERDKNQKETKKRNSKGGKNLTISRENGEETDASIPPYYQILQEKKRKQGIKERDFFQERGGLQRTEAASRALDHSERVGEPFEVIDLPVELKTRCQVGVTGQVSTEPQRKVPPGRKWPQGLGGHA